MRRAERHERDVADFHRSMRAEEFENFTHVSLARRYVYFETPKCGCSSVKSLLIRAENPLLEIPEHGSEDYEAFNEIHDRRNSPLLRPLQTFPFSKIAAHPDFLNVRVVRDPYERLLSAYLDKILGNRPPARAVNRALGRDEDAPPPDFAEFVAFVGGETPRWMNPHWRPQTLMTHDGVVRFDLEIRMERFDEGLAEFRSRISADHVPIKANNPHARGAADLIAEYYDTALFEQVHEIYAADFEALGYEKR